MNILNLFLISLCCLKLALCHYNTTYCGEFYETYATCLNRPIKFKVNSTMPTETDFMCSIVSSMTNCLYNKTYIDLTDNNLLDCACIIRNFNDNTNTALFHMYQSLSSVCNNVDLYSNLQVWLNSVNYMFDVNTTIDYENFSDVNETIKLYCENYGWFDWHTEVIQRSACIGPQGADEMLNCWIIHGRNLSNHSISDTRAISDSLINCYLIKAVKSCPNEMKKILTLFAIIDLEIQNYFQKITVDEFFIKPNLFSCERSTVSVIGDPHILAFKTDYSGPCNFNGEMICLQNEYYQINCEAVIQNSNETENSTVLNAIRLKLFYNNVEIGSYVALNGSLSISFQNGFNFLTNEKGALIAYLVIMNSSVIIIDTQSRSYIRIRVWNNMYSLHVRASDDLLKTSYGLLRSNCLKKYITLKPSTNTICYQLLNDTHFESFDNSTRDTFMDICSYDYRKFQDMDVYTIVYKALHDISEARKYDFNITNSPFDLYLSSVRTSTIISSTAITVTTTTNNAIKHINGYGFSFLLITHFILKFLHG